MTGELREIVAVYRTQFQPADQAGARRRSHAGYFPCLRAFAKWPCRECPPPAELRVPGLLNKSNR